MNKLRLNNVLLTFRKCLWYEKLLKFKFFPDCSRKIRKFGKILYTSIVLFPLNDIPYYTIKTPHSII